MKHIHIPKILKIDFDKPVLFKQQVAIMFTVLIISCLLFTVVYIQQLISGNIAAATESEMSRSSDASEKNDKPVGTSKPPQTSNGAQQSKPEDESSVTSVQEIDTNALGNMTNVTKSYEDIHYGELILVNKDYSCHLEGENVESIFETKSDSYVVTDKYVSMDPSVLDYVNSMLDDFYANYGETDIMIACGYRSYETQVSLYNNEIDSVGSEDAEKWVARPGYSEHQTGYVFDLDLNIEGGNGIDYSGEGNYAWINENCSDYGIIVRYPAGKESITGYSEEPWHFRYVGIPHSQYITNNGITLEEYLDIIHMHTSDNPMLMEGRNGERWVVYSVQADEVGDTHIPVPENHEYSISGDNCEGFIVTVKL